ncbi:MAG: hypothetical protein ACP5GY_03390 [Vulcanisaeta sp.]
MRSRATALVLYYPLILILVALGIIIAVIIPSYYAVIPEFILSLIFIYTVLKLRHGLNIGYLYIAALLLIILLSFASVFIIRPVKILNLAFTEFEKNIFRGFMYVVIYLFASLLPDSVTDLVGTLPIFLLVSAIAILEFRLRYYILAGIVTGILGIGISTVILSLIFNRIVVTYGLSAMTMGLMGSSLMASLINTIKRRNKPMHILNFLLMMYAAYESIWLLIPIPPILIINNVGINRLGHFISFLAGAIVAIFIT